MATLRRLSVSIERSTHLGRMILFSCDLTELAKRNSQSNDDLIIERIRKNDLREGDFNRLVEVWNPRVRERQIAERFDADCELWLVKIGKVVSAYGWTIKGKTIEPYFFPLQSGDVHLFDFFVYPEFRGRRINVNLVERILSDVARDGEQRAYIECASWNKPQIRSLSKTPFRRYGEAAKVIVFGRPFVIWHFLERSVRLAADKLTQGQKTTV